MYQSTLDSTRIQTNRCDSVCHLMLVANDKVVGMAADSVAFREAEASLKEQTIRMQYRFTQILADLRLEFSNQLGSLNGWLSLWIAFLATIGALLPIFMSFIVREEYKKELNSLKAEKEQEKALLLNNRLMSVANAIETLIYDDCTPLNTSYPLRVFDVLLVRAIELLEEFRRSVDKTAEKSFLLPSALSVIAGVKHIFRQVTVLLASETRIYRLEARVEDLNDSLNKHLDRLMEYYDFDNDRFNAGKEKEIGNAIGRMADECILIMNDLRALLRSEKEEQEKWI
ncbi:hypothetical protein DW083_04625 [Parabacteroides sp. AF48-14]|uniref:hypothetical protein n=1 Tax=Parabacteroides sp. AF48-14 TaxID=2292052 RepID=UPI000FF078B6|nr:hypothetical protein [Parabacteroides sp. AF48-14]RHO73798.1 hypothetical protein DW083_04625 [Parabacteroides sp. AF48-14]